MWRHCFNVRDVRSFDAIHDRYVYVRCRRGKHYLLAMANACLGLQDSIAVALDMVARRTLPRFDEVYFLAFIAFLCTFSRERRESSASCSAHTLTSVDTVEELAGLLLTPCILACGWILRRSPKRA